MHDQTGGASHIHLTGGAEPRRTARVFRWCTQWICGRDGRPSHPKLVQWAIVMSYLLPLTNCIQPVPPGVAAMLLAASFGYKAWQDWTSRATFAFTTTSAVNLTQVTHRVLAARDPVVGVDPSQPQAEEDAHV